VNDFCTKCGTKNIENNFCTKCGQQFIFHPQSYKRSGAWYLLPIVFGLAGGIFGIIGGLIAYLVLKNSDPKKGKNCLIIGIIFTLFGLVLSFLIPFTFPGFTSSLEDAGQLIGERSVGNDWIEDYWAQHPDEDPCNDPTARAFGLCG